MQKNNHRSYAVVCALILLLVMVFCFSACQNNGNETPDTTLTEEISVTPTTPEENTTPAEPATQAPATPTEPDTLPPAEPVTPGPNDIISNNPDLVYTYTDEKFQAMSQKIDRLTELLAQADASLEEEFISLYNEVEDQDFAVMVDQYMVANIQNMVYSYDESYSERFMAISQKYNDVLQLLIMMYDDIDASPYATTFFDGWTDEERAQAVAMAKTYTDELKELRVAYDALEDEYYKISNDSSFLTKSAEIYLRAVDLNKRIAKASGYDNYMDYAYEMVYERDYSPEDVAQMKEYVKTYIVPQLRNLWGKISLLSQNLSAADTQSYYTYMNSGLADLGVLDMYGNGNSRLKNSLNSYFDAVGGNMGETYYNMWKDNHFIVANNQEVSRASAFSVYLRTLGYPMFYYGPGYQNTYTVVHEFGHCYAMGLSGTSNIPMDLAEVHSQGNEWLFTSHLRSDKDMSPQAYQFMIYYKMFNDLCSICNCVAVNEFETYVYSHDQYVAESFDYFMIDIMKELGIYDFFKTIYADPVSYWHYVCIDNAGYYISYAMSMVPSLSLYCMGLENFEVAAEAYKNICVVGENDTFLGVLSRANISSPFDEKTYTDIVDAIKAVGNIK